MKISSSRLSIIRNCVLIPTSSAITRIPDTKQWRCQLFCVGRHQYCARIYVHDYVHVYLCVWCTHMYASVCGLSGYDSTSRKMHSAQLSSPQKSQLCNSSWINSSNISSVSCATAAVIEGPTLAEPKVNQERFMDCLG